MVRSMLIDEMILNLQAGRHPIVPCTRRRTHLVGWVPLSPCPYLLQITDKSFVSDKFFWNVRLRDGLEVCIRSCFIRPRVYPSSTSSCVRTSTSIPLKCWPNAQKSVELAKWAKYLRTETMLIGKTCRTNYLIEHLDQLSGEDSVSMKAWNGLIWSSLTPWPKTPLMNKMLAPLAIARSARGLKYSLPC